VIAPRRITHTALHIGLYARFVAGLAVRLSKSCILPTNLAYQQRLQTNEKLTARRLKWHMEYNNLLDIRQLK